jgi:hypothetical protein
VCCLHGCIIIIIIIIMLPNQAIASTPSAPRPSGAWVHISAADGSTSAASRQAVSNQTIVNISSYICTITSSKLPLHPAAASQITNEKTA